MYGHTLKHPPFRIHVCVPLRRRRHYWYFRAAPDAAAAAAAAAAWLDEGDEGGAPGPAAAAAAAAGPQHATPATPLALLQVNTYPALTCRRTPDWGWELQNAMVRLTM